VNYSSEESRRWWRDEASAELVKVRFNVMMVNNEIEEEMFQ
jgi:hypothetical protein